MKWSNCTHELDIIGENFVDKSIVIYGASAIGQDVYKQVNFLNAVECFVDRNENLQASGICDTKVISVAQLAKMDKKDHIVVIAVAGYNGMMIHKQLMNLGYQLGKNCYFFDTFLNYYMPIYALYAKHKLYFTSISFLLTTVCNLNCIGCLNFTSANQNRHHYDIEILKSNADSFFANVDYVKKLHLSGGEPFLYPEYEGLLNYIGENYYDRIGDIFTATNGTVVPREPLYVLLKKYDVFVEIDDYRATLPISLQNNDKIIELFKEKGIRYLDRGTDHWVNLDPAGQDNSNLTDKELGIWYDTCCNPYASIHEGKLYSCNYDDYAKEAGLVNHNEDDVMTFDKAGADFSTKKKILEFRYGFTKRGYVEFCKKCAGHEMTNKKHIPVAEQIR